MVVVSDQNVLKRQEKYSKEKKKFSNLGRVVGKIFTFFLFFFKKMYQSKILILQINIALGKGKLSSSNRI